MQFFTFTWLKEETQVAPTLEDFRDTAHFFVNNFKAKPLSSLHTSRLCAGLVEPEPKLCEGFSFLVQLQLKEEEEEEKGRADFALHSSGTNEAHKLGGITASFNRSSWSSHVDL